MSTWDLYDLLGEYDGSRIFAELYVMIDADCRLHRSFKRQNFWSPINLVYFVFSSSSLLACGLVLLPVNPPVVLVANMSQSDGGDISRPGTATQSKICQTCQISDKGKKDSKFCSRPSIHEFQKSAMQSTQLASCLVQGFGDQDVFSTPNGRNKSKRPLSADNSMDESLSDPKKFRYEDLSSITEDKELSQLDSLNKEAITKLGAALDFVKLLHERIIKLESELINAKLAFANAIINQFNSKQPFLVCQAPLTQGLPLRPSYAQTTRVEPAPVLVANLAKGSTPSDKISLEKMEQLLDSNTGGAVPSSMRQKDSTVFVRLNNPADFDRAKSILESRQNVDSINMFSSISRSSKLYPAVALFVDLSLLPGLKNELMLRNEAFKGKIDSVTQFTKNQLRIKAKLRSFSIFGTSETML
uniref:Uncharacterized protein n=1 Tax=Daphnia galeata TaxID=27404 RepID=A0A8J2RYI6_9CRUS|nr:unnamed protein product [Daphnia galeata]